MKTWAEMDARERDALVAEKLFGWVRHPLPNGQDKDRDNYTARWKTPWDAECDAKIHDDGQWHPKEYWTTGYNMPGYTSVIEDAWQVVEKMQEEGDVFIESWSDGEWTVSNKPLGFRDGGVVESAPTAPEAICLAALRAKGLDV